MTRPEEDVPELVEVATIALRLNVDEWTVRHWQRTKRRFPKPAAYLCRHGRPGASLWRWDEVYRYVQHAGGGDAA